MKSRCPVKFTIEHLYDEISGHVLVEYFAIIDIEFMSRETFQVTLPRDGFD